MTAEKQEDLKDTAYKLGKIYNESPKDYFYLKGWIHCILQKDYELEKLKKKHKNTKLGE